MEKVDDKNRNFRFLCCKNFARDVNFSSKSYFFSSRMISYHWTGGKGGHARGSLCILISNVQWAAEISFHAFFFMRVILY